MPGLLNIRKPAGVTSRRVVDRVERLVRPAKAGHAGTLDPLATGVLIVCVGSATRLIEYVQRMPKRYTATFLLGRESDTDDVEGEVVPLDDPPQPGEPEIRRAAETFVGQIPQRPPAYSAVKLQGQRAYKLARQGKRVEPAARPVTIHGIDLVRYDYPELVLDIRCGSGTYVRSLGRDLAHRLGTAAVMSELVRTAIGTFHVDAAVPLKDVTAESVAALLQPAVRAVADLPHVTLDEAALANIGHGRAIDIAAPAGATELAALDSGGDLAAILVPHAAGGWRPHRNFTRPA